MWIVCYFSISACYLSLLLHLLLRPLKDHHHSDVHFDSPISGQGHRVWRTGKHCMVRWNWVQNRKHNPCFYFIRIQESSHVVQQCVRHSEACENPVKHCVDPSPAVPYDISYMLLSLTTHCSMRVYIYIVCFLEDVLNTWPWLFSWHTQYHKLSGTSSLVLECMCTTYLSVCMCECASGKEGQVLHSSCCQGRQT